MEEIIRAHLEGSTQVIQSIAKIIPDIEDAARVIIECYKHGGKVLLFGNGGSAADAQHFAAELVGRFKKSRRSLPAISLTSNTSTITAIANDYAYETIFERQVQGLASYRDVVIGISTSGTSPNVLKGLEAANNLGAKTIALTGERGIVGVPVNVNIKAPSVHMPRIQEAHALIIHMLSDVVETYVE